MTNIVEISIKRFVSPPVFLSPLAATISLIRTDFWDIFLSLSISFVCYLCHAIVFFLVSSQFACIAGSHLSTICILSIASVFSSSRQFIYTQIQENKLATNKFCQRIKEQNYFNVNVMLCMYVYMCVILKIFFLNFFWLFDFFFTNFICQILIGVIYNSGNEKRCLTMPRFVHHITSHRIE